MIGCNAKHEVWGSTDNNERGTALLQYISSTQMGIIELHTRYALMESGDPYGTLETITFGIETVKPSIGFRIRPKYTN